MISELIMGGGEPGGLWKLHIRKRGMKRVRASDSTSNFLADQMTMQGCAQDARPMKSPTLKMTKWKEMNIRGWILGLAEIISIVMGGNTESVTVKTYAIATS